MTRRAPGLVAVSVLASVLLVAGAGCGEASSADSDAHDASERTEVDGGADPDAGGQGEDTAPAPPDGLAAAPLGGEPGLAVWARALVNEGAEPVDGLWLELEVDGVRFPLGAAPENPPLWQIPRPGDGAPSLAEIATWSLAGRASALLAGDAWLITRAPGATWVEVRARIWRRAAGAAAGVLVADGVATIDVGRGSSLIRVTPDGAPVTLWLEAAAGVGGFGPSVAAGLLLGGRPAGVADAIDAFVDRLDGRDLHIKHYHGARPHLLRPGCDSDAQCAEGGESHPCATTCACVCDADLCDCDFSGLEATMRARALGAARAVVGADASLEAVRIHYVFKRSLGGTTRCDESGELDVSAATYGAFFREAVAAAHRINASLGYRLIDALSPQNESNHPLQDGSHRDGAGGLALGGEGIGVTYAEAIERQSCLNGRCCPADRYIVADPDVPALLAAALVSGGSYLADAAAGPDGALAPEIGASLYLDVERTDPIGVDAAGAHPPIVTPVPRFLDALAAALEATPAGGSAATDFASDLIFVDTYPGSWAPPWFTTEDELVQHFDPASGLAMRYEAVAAADRVMGRARAAADAFEVRFGARPRYLLGEVGWSTFDRDEAAQARFVWRLFARAAELAEADPAFGGFLYFKDTDRAEPTYPRWEDGRDPFSGERVACDLWLLSRLVCGTMLLAEMEGQWGLFRRDGEGYLEKPAWRAWTDAFFAYVPSPSP